MSWIEFEHRETRGKYCLDIDDIKYFSDYGTGLTAFYIGENAETQLIGACNYDDVCEILIRKLADNFKYTLPNPAKEPAKVTQLRTLGDKNDGS